jgi:hypothetical protein
VAHNGQKPFDLAVDPSTLAASKCQHIADFVEARIVAV